jgi:hypothetical protein
MEFKIMGMQQITLVGQGRGASFKMVSNSIKSATFQQDARGVGMMYLTSNVGHPTLEA